MNDTPKSTEKPPLIRVVFQFLLLGFLLIAAPYASWYYLSKGVEYRQSRLAQMGHFGQVPAFTYADGNGGIQSSGDWEGKVTLLGYTVAASSRDLLIEPLSGMQAQFSEREDVQVLIWHEEGHAISFDTGDIQPVIAPRSFLDSLLQHPGLAGIREAKAVILIIDLRKELRQYYEADNPEHLKKLAEHAAILLPPQRVSKPQLQREPEK